MENGELRPGYQRWVRRAAPPSDVERLRDQGTHLYRAPVTVFPSFTSRYSLYNALSSSVAYIRASSAVLRLPNSAPRREVSLSSTNCRADVICPDPLPLAELGAAVDELGLRPLAADAGIVDETRRPAGGGGWTDGLGFRPVAVPEGPLGGAVGVAEATTRPTPAAEAVEDRLWAPRPAAAPGVCFDFVLCPDSLALRLLSRARAEDEGSVSDPG